MAILLAVLLIALVLGSLGFVLHLLWIGAVVVFVLWILGFLMRGTTGSRWYRT
jgi:hypothetical protein